MQSSLGREIWTGVLQRRGGECAPWTLQAHLRALEGLAFNSPRLGRAELGTRRPVPPVPGSPRGPHGAPPGQGVPAAPLTAPPRFGFLSSDRPCGRGGPPPLTRVLPKICPSRGLPAGLSHWGREGTEGKEIRGRMGRWKPSTLFCWLSPALRLPDKIFIY